MSSLFLVRLLFLASAGTRLIEAATSTMDWPGGALSGKIGQLADGSQQMDLSGSSSSSSPFQLPGFWGISQPATSNKRARWLPSGAVDDKDDDENDNGADNFFLLEKRAPFSLERRDSNVCKVGGSTCGTGKWCYSGVGCCGNDQMGCNNLACCPGGSVCCAAGLCCPKNYVCVTINGRRGCCKNGAKCVANGSTVDQEEGNPDTDQGDQCSDKGYGLCPSKKFCCPAGKMCLRDPRGNPSCEFGCAKTGWSICPNNNFCCPPNAQCYVDADGNNRCRVFVTTTIFVSANPTATATGEDDGGGDDEPTGTAEPTATATPSGSVEASASSSRSYKSTRTISRDKTITVTPTGGNDDKQPPASAGASPAAPVSTSPAPKVHNGGLDDIFTNAANRRADISIGRLTLCVVGSVLLSGWFMGR